MKKKSAPIIKISEAQIQKGILEYLLYRPNIAFVRHNAIKMFGGKGKPTPIKLKSWELGVADIIVCYRGRYIEFEVKTPRTKQSDNQIIRQETVEKAGGFYFVIRSIKDVETALREINDKVTNEKI